MVELSDPRALLVAQRDDRVARRRLSRRQVARHETDREKRPHDHREDAGVDRRHVVQQALHGSGQRHRSDQPQDDADGGKGETLAYHERQELHPLDLPPLGGALSCQGQPLFTTLRDALVGAPAGRPPSWVVRRVNSRLASRL